MDKLIAEKDDMACKLIIDKKKLTKEHEKEKLEIRYSLSKKLMVSHNESIDKRLAYCVFGVSKISDLWSIFMPGWSKKSKVRPCYRIHISKTYMLAWPDFHFIRVPGQENGPKV